MSVVIERIAGPFITKVTYPDLNYHLALELNNRGAITMTPEQVEGCARRAYEIFTANSGETASWDEVKNKSQWMDAVRSHEQHPEAIQRKQEPNLQETCIAQACWEYRQPAARQPLVVPPADEAKASSSARRRRESE